MGRILNEPDAQRQNLLKEIEKITKTRIGVYIANPNVSPNFMDHNDPMFFNDVLESIGVVEKLDIIIDSPGGDGNVAETLSNMCREFCKESRAIIIKSAKSAATMWALSTDKIVMGYISELGPTDPQITITADNKTYVVSAHSIINGVGQLHSMLAQGIDQRIVMTLAHKIDPPILDFASNAIAFSKDFAFRWLSEYMLKSDPDKARKIADDLSNQTLWLNHGRRIDIKGARKLGLKITEIKKDSKLWKLLWEYFCRVQIMLNNTGNAKLFETSSMSIKLQAATRRRQSQQAQESVDDAPPV